MTYQRAKGDWQRAQQKTQYAGRQEEPYAPLQRKNTETLHRGQALAAAEILGICDQPSKKGTEQIKRPRGERGGEVVPDLGSE
ncbi:hypothetical protein NDU88_007042 [Pleurodeles waltl]|uniref:Uncharacterized protein n=1 Tax=Pleurodeles waltl TaxID=8319 RepID=A0AAV7TZB2_PLEWA|nr:hypothetical protein NDU88_007042 [Pleurodeles waltl]